MYFKPLFVFHFVACFKKSYYIDVSQIGVEKKKNKSQTGWIADYWGGFYQNIYPKMCMCVLGLRWMELTF